MKIIFNIGSVTFFWILLWSTLAFFNVSGNGELSLFLYGYIFLFLFFFISSYVISYKYIAINKSSRAIARLSERMVVIFSFFVFITCVFFCYKAYNIMTSMYIWEYRTKAFGDSAEVSVLFGSQVYRIIYSILVEGGVYFLQFYFLAKYFLSQKIKYVLLGGLFVILMSFIMLGRSPLYYYFLIYIFLFINRNPTHIIKCVLIMISSFFVLYGVTYFRGGGEVDVFSFLNKYLIGYHTYGFNLLEYGIDFTNLESLWFGQATLGSFSYFLLYPIEKVFNLNLLYFNSDAYVLKQGFVLLGSGDEANAFYTIFYDMYQDFSWLGTIIYGVFFGLVYGTLQKKVDFNPNNKYILIIYFLCLNLSFGMIFRNPLATNGFVGMFIYLFLFYFISNFKLGLKGSKL